MSPLVTGKEIFSLLITEGVGFAEADGGNFAEADGEKSDGGGLRSKTNRRSFDDGLVSFCPHL